MGRSRAAGRHPVAQCGRLTDIDRRVIVNALRSNHRTGRQWRMRPNDGPPMRSVHSSFAPWNRDGIFITINAPLRNPARQALKRDLAPSISVLDSQSVTTTDAGGERGDDGEKRSTGANGNAGLIRMGSCCVCSSIRRTCQIPKAPGGFSPRIINHFPGCARFAWMRGKKG
jgi:transposase